MWIATTNGVAVNLDHCSQINVSSNGYGSFVVSALFDKSGSTLPLENFKDEESAVAFYYSIMKAMDSGTVVVDIRKLKDPNANTDINLPLRGLV